MVTFELLCIRTQTRSGSRGLAKSRAIPILRDSKWRSRTTADSSTLIVRVRIESIPERKELEVFMRTKMNNVAARITPTKELCDFSTVHGPEFAYQPI